MNVDLVTYNKVFNNHIINLNRVLSNTDASSNDTGVRTLVDVGGACGGVSEPFRTMYDKVYIIDIDAVPHNEENAIYLNADMRDMYWLFKKETVDVFLFHGSMHHCPDSLYLLFQDMYRMLKNGGHIVIMEPNRYHPPAWILRHMCKSNMHDKDERPFTIHMLHKYIKNDMWTLKEEQFFHLFTYLMPWIIPKLNVRAQQIIKKVLNVMLCADEFLMKNRIFQPFCGYMMIVLQKK